MVNHGLSTGALFLLAGILYERRHTRHIASYGGLFKSVPHFAAVFMVAALSSIALPGLNGFVGEFMIFAGSFGKFPLLTSVAISGVILSAVYMLSMYEKVFYGELSIKENENIPDLKTREWLYLLPILFFIVFIGLKPQPFLDKLESSARNYISAAQKGEAMGGRQEAEEENRK